MCSPNPSWEKMFPSFSPYPSEAPTVLIFFYLRLVLLGPWVLYSRQSPTLKFHINNSIKFVLFCIRFLSVSMMFWRCIHAVVCVSSFHFHSTNIQYFIYSLTNGHFGYFSFLQLWIQSPWTSFWKSFCGHVFISDKYLGLELLGYKVNTYLLSQETTKQFSEVLVPF